MTVINDKEFLQICSWSQEKITYQVRSQGNKRHPKNPLFDIALPSLTYWNKNYLITLQRYGG